MLKKMLIPHFWFSYGFFILAVFFGMLYSLQLLNIGDGLIRPDLARSLHISLMLYGFLTLMMTLLPFALFDKEGIISKEGMKDLERFLYLWYIFLIFMVFSIAMGNVRGLPFYDFPYELNGLLALAGFFYIKAIFKTIKNYTIKPLWVKVSLVLVIASPFALLILMNPQYGQVEKMLLGPHGDNTLGMSFALLAIYYLTIKLAAKKIIFQTKWHILWQIPLGFYVLSVLYRSFYSQLTYNMEWFFQYLTLLYIPVLYRWWKDAGLSIKNNLSLFISIMAFLFADVEGNILFIPHIRELFHRNDLVVGHAHVAVGISFLFLAFSILNNYVKISKKQVLFLTSMLALMAFVLSLSGFEQVGFWDMHITLWWALRSLFGLLFFMALFWVAYKALPFSPVALYRQMRAIDLYNTIGFLSDGIGGLLLLFFGSTLYGFIGMAYHTGYQQIVFGFVMGVGVLHLMGLLLKKEAYTYAQATALLRVLTAAGFFALYKADILGWVAYAIAGIDLLFVLIYLILKDSYEKNTNR